MVKGTSSYATDLNFLRDTVTQNRQKYCFPAEREKRPLTEKNQNFATKPCDSCRQRFTFLASFVEIREAEVTQTMCGIGYSSHKKMVEYFPLSPGSLGRFCRKLYRVSLFHSTISIPLLSFVLIRPVCVKVCAKVCAKMSFRVITISREAIGFLSTTIMRFGAKLCPDSLGKVTTVFPSPIAASQ